MTNHRATKYLDIAFFLILTGLIIALHFLVFHRNDFSDDAEGLKNITTKSLFEILCFQYFNWSGRLIAISGGLLVLNHMFIWRIVNLLLVITLGVIIGRMAFGRRNIADYAAIGLASLFLIQDRILAEAIAWVSGSTVYLWPVALGAIGFMHFAHPRVRRWGEGSILLILSSFYAVNVEQVALVMIVMATLWCIYLKYKRQATAWHFVHLVVIYVGAIFLFSAPGSQNRFMVETRFWFPDYQGFEYAQRLSLGVSRLIEHVFSGGNLMMQLLAVLLIIKLCYERISIWVKIILIAGCGVIVLPLPVKILSNASFIGWLFHVSNIDMLNFMQTSAYMRVGFLHFSLAVSIVAVCVIFIKSLNFISLQVPLLYIAGLLSIIVIGFSPTVYASGMRVLYVGDVAFAFVLCALLSKLAMIRQGRSLYYFIKYSICIFAVVQLINYFSHINTDWPFR